MDKMIFKVKKLDGYSSILELKNELSRIPGFKDVKVDITTKQIRVMWDTPAAWSDFEKKLTEIGYPPLP